MERVALCAGAESKEPMKNLGADSKPRILVVDDEPRMGKAMARLLGHRYQVTLAASAEQALAVLDADGNFDGIVCDLMMPEMSGMEMYEHLRPRRPTLAERMVFMTGGAYTDEAQEFLARFPHRRLDKPFRPEDLDRALEQALGD
jgi:CheY-like chemotaxis protein